MVIIPSKSHTGPCLIATSCMIAVLHQSDLKYLIVINEMAAWLPVVSSESCHDHNYKHDLRYTKLFFCATQAGKKQTCTVKNTGICTNVTSCPITRVSLVTHSRLTLPQAKDRLPPLIWTQHAAMVHAGALWGGSLYTPHHFLEGSAGGAWKLPNGRIFTRWRGAPFSSPPPLTSTATWPKAMRMTLKKALDLLYLLFTNNVSWLSYGG